MVSEFALKCNFMYRYTAGARRGTTTTAWTWAPCTSWLTTARLSIGRSTSTPTTWWGWHFSHHVIVQPKHIQLMTASMVHVYVSSQLVTPGNDNPTT
jgi:hypothetical protein